MLAQMLQGQSGLRLWARTVRAALVQEVPEAAYAAS